jgi:predicted transcriptional regulator
MARRAKKLEPISIRLDEDVRRALEAMAVDEERSMSQIINRAVRDYAVQRGYMDALPAAKPRARS